jgi:polyvinyl alcohol dehydrogenase (cytochrome)
MSDRTPSSPDAGRKKASPRLSSRAARTNMVAAVCAFLGVLAVPVIRAGRGPQEAAPSATQREQIEVGRKLYAADCVFCHGVNGVGTGVAPSLRTVTGTAEAIADVISRGKTGTTMPAFAGTHTPQQIASIAAFVVSLSSQNVHAPAVKTGEVIYTTKCASCHETGAPPFLSHFALKAAAPEYVVYMLAAGAMHKQGAELTSAQRVAVAEYITGKRLASSSPQVLCPAPASAKFSGPHWNGWGVDLENSRFQPADQAGLTSQQVPGLKLKWAFGLPGDFTAYSQPVVAGGRVFVGDSIGGVYSLDASTGCTYWKLQAAAAVRTALALGPGGLAYFGDVRSNVYAVNATTGKLVWKRTISNHPYTRVTGSPRLYNGRLYVPVSSREEWMAADPNYPCCTSRGILVALDAASGNEIWRTYSIPEEPRLTRKGANGKELWGPSGAGIWTSPTVDEDRQLLYVGTGDNYSDPATSMSDALLAVDINTGKIAWSNQITHGDTFNASCVQKDASNCPAKPGPDADFASSPILRKLASGQRILVVTQKSGEVLGLDPDHEGKILWRTSIGHGGVLGGIQWGAAADSELVYVALSDVGFTGGPEGSILNPKSGGGLFAIRIATGEKVWVASPPAVGCPVNRCSPAQSAAVSAIAGAVFSGSDDGHLRAYSTADGKILWDFNTLGEFKTVNKRAAHGGSMDGGGAAIAGGMVFVNSGSGSAFGIPGSILLAFSRP